MGFLKQLHADGLSPALQQKFADGCATDASAQYADVLLNACVTQNPVGHKGMEAVIVIGVGRGLRDCFCAWVTHTVFNPDLLRQGVTVGPDLTGTCIMSNDSPVGILGQVGPFPLSNML